MKVLFDPKASAARWLTSYLVLSSRSRPYELFLLAPVCHFPVADFQRFSAKYALHAGAVDVDGCLVGGLAKSESTGDNGGRKHIYSIWGGESRWGSAGSNETKIKFSL